VRIVVLILVGYLAASQAEACSTHPVPQAIIYKTKPSDTSSESTMIKAKIVEELPKFWTVRMHVLEGPSNLEETDIFVSPAVLTSCTTIGRNEGYLAIKLDKDSNEPNRFVGEVFERSWFDWIIDLFGGEPYYFSGARINSSEYEFMK